MSTALDCSSTSPSGAPCVGWPDDERWSCNDHGAHRDGKGNTWPASEEKWLGSAAEAAPAGDAVVLVREPFVPNQRAVAETLALFADPDPRPALTVEALELERVRLVGVIQALRLTAIRSAPAWQCSGCRYIFRGSMGRSGECPRCHRDHYLSGSVDPEALAAHDADALEALGAP